MLSHYCSAADNGIAVVEYDSLSPCYCPLRLVKYDMQSVFIGLSHCCPLFCLSVTYLGFYTKLIFYFCLLYTSDAADE